MKNWIPLFHSTYHAPELWTDRRLGIHSGSDYLLWLQQHGMLRVVAGGETIGIKVFTATDAKLSLKYFIKSFLEHLNRKAMHTFLGSNHKVIKYLREGILQKSQSVSKALQAKAYRNVFFIFFTWQGFLMKENIFAGDFSKVGRKCLSVMLRRKERLKILLRKLSRSHFLRHELKFWINVERWWLKELFEKNIQKI